jgi:hypothetical protein
MPDAPTTTLKETDMRKTLVRATLAAAAALVVPFAALGADNVPPEALNVKVFPDRYVVAGTQFADAAALEAWAKPVMVRTVWLDTCSPASTKALLAAVEKFQGAYADGIQIRSLSPREAGCATADAVGRRPGTDYFATDEQGRSMVP